MSAIINAHTVDALSAVQPVNQFSYSFPQDVISKITENFIANDTWQQALAESLSKLGNSTGINKIQVIDCHIQNNLLLICEWHKEISSSASKHNTELIQPVLWEKIYHSLSSEKIYKISTENVLNDSEKLYLRLSKSQRLWAIPLKQQNEKFAFIILESAENTLPFSENDFLEILNLLQNICVAKITQEKRNEVAKKFENRYEIISRATNDALYDWDIITNKVWRNDTARILFGCHDQANLECVNWWHSNIHPNDRERVTNSLKEVLKYKKKFWTSEYRFECASGLYKHVLDQAYIEYDEAGNPYRRIGSMRDISKHKLLEENAVENKEELRVLARKLQTAKEDERKKLSQELHDDVAQTLVALKMNLDWIDRKTDSNNSDLKKVISDSADISGSLMQKIKQLAIELRPKLIDDLGLSESIKWQIDEYERKIAFKYNIHQHIDDIEVNPNLSVEIFRIFQELMNNIFKHANAKTLFISLRRIDNSVILNLKDDGCGFDQRRLNKDKSGIGLLGIKERVLDNNGVIKINSQFQKGTSVYLSMPL